MRKTGYILLIILQIVLLALPPDVAAAVGYKLLPGATTQGGGTRTSSSYKISHDTIGGFVGTTSSATYKLSSGFVATSTSYNHAPVLADIGDQSISENEPFSLIITATDADQDALTYSVAAPLPSGASFDATTATFDWTPTFDQEGNYYVTFIVDDGKETDSEEIVITVGNVNRPPVLEAIGNQTVDEMQKLDLTISATDPDGDALTFTITGKPACATFADNLNGTADFSWTPGYDEAGIYPTVAIEVSDGDLPDNETIQITVKNINRAPQLINPGNSIPDIVVDETDTAVMRPEQYYEDPDGDQLTFSYSAHFDNLGKWITTYDDAGAYTVTVSISDGIAPDIEQSIQVTVNNVNRPPEAELTLSSYTVNRDELFEITLSAIDLDGDDMAFTIEKDGVQIASEAITTPYSMTTSIPTAGDHAITATVTDSNNASSPTYTKTLDVIDPNQSRSDFYPVMGDFNGDAVTDLGLHNNVTGVWEIAISDDGTFTSALDWLDESDSFGASKDWITLGGDFNGDGYNDIGIYNNTTGECKIALSTGSGFSVQSSPWLTFTAATYDWQPLTGDFNGDGKTDFGLYDKKNGIINIALSGATSFAPLSEWISGFGGTDEQALAGDFNGDGLADVALYKEGNWQVALSTGSSFMGKGTWKTGYASNGKILIADFNSDGLVDIGYFDAGAWHYAISNGFDTFVDKSNYHSGFGTSGLSAHTGDFNGDGIVDLATFDQQKDGIERWEVCLEDADFSDLLVAADNGIGGVTTISYDYASKQANDLLPFPVHVVKSVSITDNKPDGETPEIYSTEHAYQGGYYSYQDREFRGFQRVTSTDPITGNYTQVYFLQGKDGQEGALKGQIEKIVAYDGNLKQISEITNTYEVKKGGPLDNNLGFPHIKEVYTKIYEENTSYVETTDSFEYDNLGNVIQTINNGDLTTDADNKITKTDYAKAYTELNRVLVSQLLDKDNQILSQKRFEYDDKGNLERQIDYYDEGIDPETSFGYDDYGNVTSTVNANGRTVYTSYEYTFNQFPEEISNELGHSIRYTYEPKFGLVTAITDANANTTTTVYDTLGRITEERNAYGALLTSYSYPDFNTKITTQLNLTKTEYVDGLGRNYKTVTVGEDGALARDVVTEKFFNNRGLLEAESMPHYVNASSSEIAYIRYDYDMRGRVYQATADFPGSLKDATTQTQYLSPLSTKVIDPKGHAKTTIKDVYGNIIEVVEHTSQGDYHTYYTYDLKSNLVTVKDAQNNITQIFYDSLGRKTSMIDPDTGTTEYTYDAMGNIKTQIDNKGQAVTFVYDAINRLERKEYDSPTMSDVVYTYDALDPPDSTGRLSSIDDGASQTSYEYDKEGRVVKVTRIIDENTYITQTSYDTLGRIAAITYPDSEVVSYSYDANSGLLESVSSYINDITYNAQGQILAIQYGNNTQTTYTYNNDQRLQRILTTDNGQLTTLQDLNYDFDKAGNLTQLTDNIRSNIRYYQYDDLNRLTRAENIPDASGTPLTYTYQYDAIGNMTYKSDIGEMTYLHPAGGGGPGPHAVISAGGYSYEYDANGNMTYGRGKDLAYDAENRLIEVDNLGQITTFEYNHSGNRIKKVTADETITYIGKLYEERLAVSGERLVKKHIYTGSDRSITVEHLRGGGDSPEVRNVYYCHSDHLGSSNIITDGTGAQVQHVEYQPYGKVTQNEGDYDSPYKFTGKELDTTGLYYYGARYYDPEIGRFISADPTIQRPYDPQDLNRYTYCRNNPLRYTDPTGYSWLSKIVGAIVGIIVGVASGNPTLGSMAYSFTSTAIESYQAGYSLGRSVGASALSAVAAFVGGQVGGAYGDWMGGGQFGQTLFASIGANVAGSTAYAAATGQDIGKAALSGAIWGTAMGTVMGVLTHQSKGDTLSDGDSEVPSGPDKSGNTNDIIEKKKVAQGGSPQPTKTPAQKASKALRNDVVKNPTPPSTPFNIFGKIKRTLEWITWIGGRIYSYWQMAPIPDVYPPPPGWKREDWYGVPISLITNSGG